MAPKAAKVNNHAPDLVLYYHPQSFHSQKVVMALHQKKVNFRPYYVNIMSGRQYKDSFLTLNPKGEVPVLVDDFRVIPESEHIINYLEDNFSNGSPRLRPTDPDLRVRVDQMFHEIHELKVDALTFGSVYFDSLTEIDPKAPYDNMGFRNQTKTWATAKAKGLEQEIIRHPNHADALRKKLHAVKETDSIWTDKNKFLDLVLGFEKVMDECEAELQSHEDPRWWLCTPDLSVADVAFAILLHRLWQLGFERRMWGNRPHIKRYYSRVQQLDSFNQAITMKGVSAFSEFFSSPYLWGFLGAAALAGGGWYYYNNHLNMETTSSGSRMSSSSSSVTRSAVLPRVSAASSRRQ